MSLHCSPVHMRAEALSGLTQLLVIKVGQTASPGPSVSGAHFGCCGTGHTFCPLDARVDSPTHKVPSSSSLYSLRLVSPLVLGTVLKWVLVPLVDLLFSPAFRKGTKETS